MRFADKLKKLMKELELTQVQVSELTGISKSNISHYIHGKHEPSAERKKIIAAALGVEEEYFKQIEVATTISNNCCINLPVPLAAKLMGKSREWVMQGLRDGVFPWGYAVKLSSKWSYFISSTKFTEYTGIEVCLNDSDVA